MRLNAAASALLLCSLFLPLPAPAQPTPVGERQGTTEVASAAVRDATHRPMLRYTVWYPATAAAREQPLRIGPPDAPLFEAGHAAAGAPIAAGRWPTLLLSHGNGGSARMMGWFGTAMARAGYVVIAVDHPGNNGVDPMTLAGSVLLWERAADLKAALAAVQADPQLGAHVDATRLGVAGFSAGGFTALAAAGARVDLEHLAAFCRAQPNDGVCRPQLEMPEATMDTRLAAARTPALAPYLEQAGNDHGIAGVRAVFLMAPAIVQAFPTAQLRALKAPVAMVLGQADTVAPPATNGEVVAAHLPATQVQRLPGVGHYDFLATCTAIGRHVASVLCTEAVPRQATHQVSIDAATALFNTALAGPSAPAR